MSDTGEGPQFDLNGLLSQLGEVQQNLQQAQQSAAAQIVEGSAGGGAVRVKTTGGLEFKEIIINPSVVDSADVEMLQDLILAAVRDAVEKAGALNHDALGTIGLGGIDLGGLLGQ